MHKENLYLFLGMFLSVISFKYVLIPSGINIGGFAGISQILNTLWGIPYIISTILMNGLLYLWGFRRKGYKFVARSILATIMFSMLLDIPPILTLPTYPIWLTVLIATIGVGCGFGLILSANASTGGSDLLAAIIAEFFPKISIGRAMIATNLTIISVTGLITGFIYGKELFIISIVTTIFSNMLIDFVYCLGTNKPLPLNLQLIIAKIKKFIPKKISTSTLPPVLGNIPALNEKIIVEINGIKITFQVIDILPG